MLLQLGLDKLSGLEAALGRSPKNHTPVREAQLQYVLTQVKSSHTRNYSRVKEYVVCANYVILKTKAKKVLVFISKISYTR